MAHVALEDRATGKLTGKKLITDSYKEMGQEKPGAGSFPSLDIEHRE